jgi:hypothetical protein
VGWAADREGGRETGRDDIQTVLLSGKLSE